MTSRPPSSCGSTTAGSVVAYRRPYVDSRPSSSSASSGLDWISTCALEQESCAKPGRVSSSVTVLPPTTSRASSTQTSSPAAARYAAQTSPLWPAPITTTSVLSGSGAMVPP